MADNVTIDEGADKAIAADDISSVWYQRIKITLGANGSNDGDVSSANPMPVSGTFYQATQPVSIAASVAVTGTFWQATQPVSLASLPALPAGTNNIGDVDVLTVNGVAPAFGSGVRGATVQRVTIATDDVVPISDNGGSITVDGTVTINAIPAGTNNIGDVDVLTLPALAAGENHIGEVGGKIVELTSGFNRPADTTAYASGDLVANNTASGSVTPLSFTAARVNAGSGSIRRARIRKTNTGVTNANFRVHLYNGSAAPAVTNGDNGAWLSDNFDDYLGAIDVTVDKVFSDGAVGEGAPNIGGEINFVATAQTIWALIEARGAYTPGNAETITVELEIWQN